MAAMKPRTGDGPLEATKEGRGIVMRVPLEGGGRLVVELTPDEAAALGDELKGVTNTSLQRIRFQFRMRFRQTDRQIHQRCPS